jgi:xanthine dehydrogenase accessory factor
MFNTHQLFAFAAAAQDKGQRVALATLYDVTGASSRNPGAHLAVSEDGCFTGSLSEGCVEQAIVNEALAALADRQPRELRLGQGSPYIDIRLPCGGSIDLLFNELPMGMGQQILDRIEAREAFGLRLPRGEGAVELARGGERFGVIRSAGAIVVDHVPPLRLVIFGQGQTVACLHDLARAIGIATLVVTPEQQLADAMAAQGGGSILLKGLGDIPALPLDRWSACALFFHDHDWDGVLLGPILASDAFHIGAMGSRTTHERRCAMLAATGIAPERIAAIAAPIGLIHSLRDPETLAVSTLVQVVDAYNRAWL